MTKIEEYANEIPIEIRRAIRGLDSDHRAGIFVAFLKHGELSFTDLQRKLELDKPTLTYHLRRLSECALVEHYYKHELGADQYSYYSVTRFGQNFVEALSCFLRPQVYDFRFPKETSQTTHPFNIDYAYLEKLLAGDPRMSYLVLMLYARALALRISHRTPESELLASIENANTSIPEPVTEREQSAPSQTV
jgi:DNA-binding MarR family transcriptional regulator